MLSLKMYSFVCLPRAISLENLFKREQISSRTLSCFGQLQLCVLNSVAAERQQSQTRDKVQCVLSPMDKEEFSAETSPLSLSVFRTSWLDIALNIYFYISSQILEVCTVDASYFVYWTSNSKSRFRSHQNQDSLESLHFKELIFSGCFPTEQLPPLFGRLNTPPQG